MKQVKFENIGVEVSQLGFGCMRFPVNEDRSINEPEALELLQCAIKGGVTYIDTAYPYHDGTSEEFVGRALQPYDRGSYRLATKLPVWKVEKTEDVAALFYEQLGKLRTEYVDFYLLHALDKERWEKIVELDMLGELDKLKAAGRIKYIGFSFHDELPVFEEIINARPWDFCQIQLNYIDRNIQQGMRGYEIAEALGIPLVIMEPVKGGALAKLPEEMTAIFNGVDDSRSVASWAFRFLGSLPNVKVILSGMTTMEQLEDNLKTFADFSPLNEKEQAAVEQVTKVYRGRQKNRCTTCEYCMPCPFGVKIPNNFKLWNTGYIYEDLPTAKQQYFELEAGERASACQECGSCEPKCPQGIEIIEDLKKVAALFES